MLDGQQQPLKSVVMGQMPGVGGGQQHQQGQNQNQQGQGYGAQGFNDSGFYAGGAAGGQGYSNQAYGGPQGGNNAYMNAGGPADWGGTMGGSVSIEDEPPLLEELGIDFTKIYQKTISVLNPMVKVTQDMLYTRNAEGKLEPDNDLAGPILIALMLGSSMMLRGKLNFGYIYGLFLVGCLSIWLVMTLMSKRGMDVYQTASILGYCLLPMVLLAFFSVFFSATGPIMTVLASLVVGWCSWRSSDMFVVSMDVHNEKALVGYPVALFYTGFALLTVF